MTQNIFSQEELNSMLEGVKTQVVATMQQSLTDQLAKREQWELQQQIKTTVAEWFNSEMKPIIIAELNAQKEAIAEIAVGMGHEMVKAAVEATSKQIAKTLSSDYDRQNFFKAMLGIR